MQVHGHQTNPNPLPSQVELSSPPSAPAPPHSPQGWQDYASWTQAPVAQPINPAPSGSNALVNLLGLSRLQHVLHFVQPVRAVMAKLGGSGKAAAHTLHVHAHSAKAMQGLSTGARFMLGVGGKLGLLSALVSVPIFWMDLKSAKQDLADPSVTNTQKAAVKLNVGLSGFSAAAGLGALAAAGLGLVFPPAFAVVGLLATASGLSGMGSFIASRFGRSHTAHSSHEGARTALSAATPATRRGTLQAGSAIPQPVATEDEHRWHLQGMDTLIASAQVHSTMQH